MIDTLYDKIREENKRKYGTQVSVYGPVLLANLYSDRTHFIYEFLQNAEDACERARKQGQTREFHISFELYPDRLEVRHNGIPFDENDVRGICGIVEATKDKDLLQIGKFGIGFKSVYAYTTSPQIYSEDRTFCIRDYVHPSLTKPRKDVKTGETLFVIRFDDKTEDQEAAYSEIESRLRNLGLRTLLFLRNIEEISYKTGSTDGKYLKHSEVKNGARQVSLDLVEKEDEIQSERWLIFDKALDRDRSRKLEIAYLLVHDSQSKKDKIIPASDVKLFAYFPTEKETHLRFLIHGPYDTTPARDNIRNDKWNRELIEETATLVSDNISRIKTLNLLDIEFLNTLPIDTEHFTEESTMFRPIYEKVKEKLSSEEEALLPTYDDSFATANQAFIARGKDLRLLLSGQQLDLLFERKGSKWLDENITEDKTPELRRYLINELEIEEVDPELFARAFNEEFIYNQSDQWVISFYGFLLNQKALWTASAYGRAGLLRLKPIIRLNDNSHTAPFDDDGKPIVYRPHKDPSVRKLFPKVVKNTIALDKKAREFLKSLGVNEPDKVAGILALVLPLYKEITTVSEKDNMKHVEWILGTLEDCEGSRRDKLLSELKETPCLCAINASSQRKEYRKPTEIHLGQKYTDNESSEIYFEGNEEIWFLDERYLALKSAEKIMEKLKEIGCKPAIQVWYRKPGFPNYVILDNYWGWHRRGLDGFDPDCEIEGLEHALENINIERSEILWRIAKEYRRSIYGEVESCPRQNYDESTKKWQFSKMGKLLAENPWLPERTSSSFHNPSELTLSELPGDFDKESLEAKYVADKLGFKPELDQESRKLLEKTPEKAREILEIYMTASPEIQQHILESIRAIKLSESAQQPIGSSDTTTTITVSPAPSELEGEFKKSLSQERLHPISIENKTWTGPTPEEEEKMRKIAQETMAKLLKPQEIERGRKKVSYIKTEGEGGPVLKMFLLEQYKGHCQVCNAKLDLGPNKDPYFEIYRIIEKRRLYGVWSDKEFNILCLCPNCHALMKHGGRDLGEIFNKAKRVADGEEAPEEVEERRGDFYIVPITIAGKQRELFYTPLHMARISAFVRLTEDDV